MDPTRRADDAEDARRRRREEGMLERIRDLILAAEREHLDRRFRGLEAKVMGALDEHQRIALERFERLETHLQRELEARAARLEEGLERLDVALQIEASSREMNVEAVRKACASLRDDVEAGQVRLGEALTQARQDLDRARAGRERLARTLQEGAAALLGTPPDAPGDPDA